MKFKSRKCSVGWTFYNMYELGNLLDGQLSTNLEIFKENCYFDTFINIKIKVCKYIAITVTYFKRYILFYHQQAGIQQ